MKKSIYTAILLVLAVSSVLAQDLIPYRKGGKWGYANRKKQIVVAAVYDSADPFSEGRARVGIRREDRLLYGFIDRHGKEIVPLKYISAEPFSEGLACVRLDSLFGYVDDSGNIAVPMEYSSAKSFKEGLACVQTRDGYCFIDPSGRKTILAFGSEPSYFSGGLALVRVNGKYGFMDKSGAAVIPPKYDYAGAFSEGLAVIKVEGRYGYVDAAGKEVVPTSSFRYTAAFPFSGGLGLVGLGSRADNLLYTYVDKTGREVMPPRFTKALPFSDGLAMVSLTGRLAFIDTLGNTAIPVVTDSPDSFSEGLAVVTNFTLGIGYMDKSGVFVIPPGRYSKAGPFHNGIARVEVGGQEEIISSGPEGDYVVQEKVEGKPGYIDANGTEYWE